MEREHGHNVTIVASFYRHGEKDEDGLLTDRGYADAINIGRDKDTSGAGVKIFTSPFDRTKDSATGILEGIRERVSQGEADPGFKALAMKEKIELAPPKWNDLDTKAMIKAHGSDYVARMFLEGEEYQDNLNHWTSALAYMVDKYAKIAVKCKNGFKLELGHVTHDIVIMDFLRKLMIVRDDEGSRQAVDFDKLGGHVKFLENFDVIIKTDEQGELGFKIDFRGQEYDLDTAEVEELAHIFESQPYVGRGNK